jgi:hypothetical protein
MQPHGWSRSAVHRDQLMHRGQGDKDPPSLRRCGVAVQVGLRWAHRPHRGHGPHGRPPLGVADLDCPRWRVWQVAARRQRGRGLTDWWTGSSNRSQRHRWAAWRFDAVWRWKPLHSLSPWSAAPWQGVCQGSLTALLPLLSARPPTPCPTTGKARPCWPQDGTPQPSQARLLAVPVRLDRNRFVLTCEEWPSAISH